MEIVPFNSFEHLNQLKEWINGRENNHLDINLLPQNGLIIPGLAAIFWWHTDGPVVFMDALITNPKADRYKRREAAESLISLGCEVARTSGVSRIYFYTKQPAMIEHYSKLFGCKLVLDNCKFYQWDSD